MLGKDEEIQLVQRLNQKQDILLRKELGLDPHNKWAVYVDKMIFSNVSEEIVFPKSDLYIVEGELNLHDLETDNYIIYDSKNILPYVSGYGISVKLINSDRYTITKMRPNTFKKIFKNLELGAGASIYCKDPEEFIKNNDVIEGWGVTINDFIDFFSLFGINITIQDITTSQSKLKEIKAVSNEIIKSKILTELTISNFIFKGEGAFNEPYCAHWLFHHNMLTKDITIPFTVTTGSGRSKGEYTIVIKPL